MLVIIERPLSEWEDVQSKKATSLTQTLDPRFADWDRIILDLLASSPIGIGV